MLRNLFVSAESNAERASQAFVPGLMKRQLKTQAFEIPGKSTIDILTSPVKHRVLLMAYIIVGHSLDV